MLYVLAVLGWIKKIKKVKIPLGRFVFPVVIIV